MINKLDSEISFFENTFAPPGTSCTIQAILTDISSGKYFNEITNLRLLYKVNINEYKRLKSVLPAVTFSGKFDKSRIQTSLINYTGVIVLDVDHLSENGESQQFEDLKLDPLVLSFWKSPSNDGLKILIETDAKSIEHKLFFSYLINHFKWNYNLDIDKSGSDITRLCYVSYDPDLFVNKNNKILLRIDIESDFNKKNDLSALLSLSENDTDKAKFNPPQGYNPVANNNNKATINKIIRYLNAYNKSITNSYENWYRVALALSNTFKFPQAEHYFLKLCRLDGNLHEEDKSSKLIRYVYINRRPNVVNFNTLIYLAQQEGFDLNWSKEKKS